MRRVCLLIAVVAVAGTLWTLPAHAAGATSAHCTFSFREHFTPGFTLAPTSGTEGTGGETGTISCTGAFEGKQVTGPGTLGVEGTFTGITCFFDGAPFDGRYAVTVPTDAGPLHIQGSVTDHRIGLVDVVEGTGPGAVFQGLLVLVPTQGTCVLSPVTEALILGDVTFTPSA